MIAAERINWQLRETLLVIFAVADLLSPGNDGGPADLPVGA